MRVLVVVAHPRADSYCYALARAVVDGCESAGRAVDVIDLYAEGYVAAMSPDERRAYHSVVPVVDEQVARHITLLRGADTLVMVYPTWWSSMPAIMKGWLERTMVPGVGFDFADNGKVRPALTHIRHLVGVSTYGSKRTYVRLINDNGRRTISRALRLSTGVRTRLTWLAMYGVDGSSPDERAAFLDRVSTTMKGLS